MLPANQKKNATPCRFGDEYCRQFNNLAYCSTRKPNQRRPNNKVTPILETTASMRKLSNTNHHQPTLELKTIMKKACKQPKHTGNCISNHVQVNNERHKHGLQTLCRHTVLDQVAHDHAQRMATSAATVSTTNKGRRMTKKELQEDHHGEKVGILPPVPQESRKQMLQLLEEEEEEARTNNQRHSQQQEERNISPSHHDSSVSIGRNVATGHSVLEIHSQMMFGDGNENSSLPTSKINSTDNKLKNNILNPQFKYFGMGTTKCETSGKLYLCQLFL